jgi:ketopantoate hydroxymethyltransferase
MVQISRIFLRRVPSITFPVRMIDGVRVTGKVASGKKNVVVDERFSTKKASSSSSSFSKAPPVISEEECEIVNVSVS